MKRRSYLSSRESRSFLHLDLRNGREKFTFIHFSFFRKIRGAEVAETRGGASRSLVVARSRISARHPRDFSKD